MQYYFYFDQTRCTGCETCVVACKDWNDVPAGPASWRRVITLEKGKYPDVLVAFYSASCYHCAQPTCVSACPANAIHKRRDDGIVVVDRQACLGRDHCDMCLHACPYGIPQFGAEANAKMQKCDFCVERWALGKKPICVDGCPLRALDAGPAEDMKARYGDRKEAEGLTYSDTVKPAIIVKPKTR